MAIKFEQLTIEQAAEVLTPRENEVRVLSIGYLNGSLVVDLEVEIPEDGSTRQEIISFVLREGHFIQKETHQP